MSDQANSVSEKVERPLSPHLQVYRLPYNALMSIIGRAVGIGLSVFTTIVFAWFVAAVFNPSFYDATMSFLSFSFSAGEFDVEIIKYALWLLSFVVFFYLGNGVRHVLWDFVIGVHDKKGVVTGNIVLVLSVLLTIGVIVLSI